MTWFAAHIIMYVRYKNTNIEQCNYYVFENIYLINSDSVDAAYEKAKNRGIDQEGDSNGTLIFNGEPSELVYGGIRKLIECQNSPEKLIENPFSDNKPEDGAEISYSQFIVNDKNDLIKLINGDPVKIEYSE